MKNETFIQSILCAVRGFVYALKTEKNYKYYTMITFAALVINLITKVEFYCYIFQVVTSIGVFSCECVNTSIEHLCNKVTADRNQEIKLAKDIAAGAVLCWGILFFILEILFIGRALCLDT